MRKPKLLGRVALVAAASLAGISGATVAAVVSSTTAFAAPTETVTYQGTDTATQYEGYAVTLGALPAGTFTGGSIIEAVECSGTVATPPADASSCDGVTGTTYHANADGSFSGGTYQIYLVGVHGYAFQNSGGVVIDASGHNPGVIFLGDDLTDFTQPKTFANFSIGIYGRIVAQTSSPKASATSTVTSQSPSTLNAAAGAPTVDSAQVPMTFTGFSVTTPPAPANGSASCTTAGVCTYSPNATFTGSPTTDTYGVTATATAGGAAVPIPSVTETVPLNHPLAPSLNPTPNPASATSNASGTTVTITPQATAVDSGGNPEPISAVTAGATANGYGTVSCAATSPYTCTYTVGTAPAAGGTDTFPLTATADGLTSAPKTVTVNIPASFQPACDVTTTPSCNLNQIVNIPVTAGDLTMGQNSGLPVDSLGATLTSAGACSGPALKLNGQPQYACGNMAPITVINARGTDAGWDLSGQITDFIDSGKVTPTSLTPVSGVTPVGTLNSSCDSVANYNNHCIPGNNAGWIPAASVAQNMVPGDVAEVAPGANLNAPGLIAPSTATGILGGNCGTFVAGSNAGTYYTTTNSAGAPAVAPCVVQPSAQTYPNYIPTNLSAGLHSAAQSLCDSSEATATVNGENTSIAAGHAGGTFVCGAELVVAVPASAAAPTVASSFAPAGYQAFLTLTLA